MKDNNALEALTQHCCRELLPYLEKVLERIPEQIRSEEILGDPQFRIMSFDPNLIDGTYVLFSSPANSIIVLNEKIRNYPEYQIVHTIAHELAHKITYRKGPGLWEKEAEKLIREWGFEHESELVNYHRPILESHGFDIGYAWGKKNDLSDYEEYYNEWNEGRLSPQRLDQLHYMTGIDSILDEICPTDEHENVIQDSNSGTPNDTINDDGSLDKGIIYGIMHALKEKRRVH